MIPFTAHSGYNVVCSGLQLANLTRSVAMCEVIAQVISGTCDLRASDSKMSVLTASSANTLFMQSHEMDGCPRWNNHLAKMCGSRSAGCLHEAENCIA